MQCFFFKCEFHMKEVEDGRPEDENSKLGGNKGIHNKHCRSKMTNRCI